MHSTQTVHIYELLPHPQNPCSWTCKFCIHKINKHPFPINCIFCKECTRSVGEPVCPRLYNRVKTKQVTCTARTQFTSTDHSVTPQNQRSWPFTFCMDQVNKHPFCHKFEVKHGESNFCFFGQLKTIVEKSYRVLKNIYPVVILCYHLRNHHRFVIYIIFVGMIVFLLPGWVCQKMVWEREGFVLYRG